jgi:hypothetical protein
LLTFTSTSIPPPKTPEELLLENTSLRSSLDAISRHSHMLENEVRRLRESEEKKGEMMRSVVMGVRREVSPSGLDVSVEHSRRGAEPASWSLTSQAQKAIHSQELYRSQMLQAPLAISPTAGPGRGGVIRAVPGMVDNPGPSARQGGALHKEPSAGE